MDRRGSKERRVVAGVLFGWYRRVCAEIGCGVVGGRRRRSKGERRRRGGDISECMLLKKMEMREKVGLGDLLSKEKKKRKTGDAGKAKVST